MRFKYLLADTEQLFQVVTLGIICRDRKVVLIQEGSKAGHGRWTLPYVICERSAVPSDGLERAVTNLTGLRAKVSQLVTVTLAQQPKQPYGQVALIYAMNLISGELKTQSDAVLNLDWFSYNQIFRMPKESFLHPIVRSAIKAFRKKDWFDLEVIRTAAL